MLFIASFLRRTRPLLAGRRFVVAPDRLPFGAPRPPNGRFLDPLCPRLPGPLAEPEDLARAELESAPHANPYAFGELMKEVDKYNQEWRADQLPQNMLDFLVNTTVIYEQMKRIEVRNQIEMNAGRFKHKDVVFLKANDAKETKKRIEKPVIPLEPDLPQPGYESIGYGAKQERLSLDYNYNFEQYKDFARLHAAMLEKEGKKEAEERRLLNYVKNVEDKVTDGYLQRMNMTRGMIKLNEEDAKLGLKDVKVPGKKKKKKKTINERKKGDLASYDAWRCSDRELITFDMGENAVAKVKLIPAMLVKMFGMPRTLQVQDETSGEYSFEDSNLDLFALYDYKQTTKFWGPNIQDPSFYEFESDKRKPRLRERLHKTMWPSPEQFWESQTPMMFRINCSEYADIRLFRQWLDMAMKKAEEEKLTLDERMDKKYGPNEFYNDYDATYQLNKDYTIYKYDSSFFLTDAEKEAEDYQPLPQLKKPKMFDMAKAERVLITREELIEKARKAAEDEKLRKQKELYSADHKGTQSPIIKK